MKKFACRCCKYLSFLYPPDGDYSICPICFWEDDPLQYENQDLRGGANLVSLHEARQNFLIYGAIQKEFSKQTRKPNPDEIPTDPIA